MNAIEKQYKLEPNHRLSHLMTALILIIIFLWSMSTIKYDEFDRLKAAKYLAVPRPEIRLIP